MAHAPRAGTGDSACRSWRYWCATTWNRQGNLSTCGTSLCRLLPLLNNRGWQLRQTCLLVVYAFFLGFPTDGFVLGWQKYNSVSWIVAKCEAITSSWDTVILQICPFPSPRHISYAKKKSDNFSSGVDRLRQKSAVVSAEMFRTGVSNVFLQMQEYLQKFESTKAALIYLTPLFRTVWSNLGLCDQEQSSTRIFWSHTHLCDHADLCLSLLYPLFKSRKVTWNPPIPLLHPTEGSETTDL